VKGVPRWSMSLPGLGRSGRRRRWRQPGGQGTRRSRQRGSRGSRRGRQQGWRRARSAAKLAMRRSCSWRGGFRVPGACMGGWTGSAYAASGDVAWCGLGGRERAGVRRRVGGVAPGWCRAREVSAWPGLVPSGRRSVSARFSRPAPLPRPGTTMERTRDAGTEWSSTPVCRTCTGSTRGPESVSSQHRAARPACDGDRGDWSLLVPAGPLGIAGLTDRFRMIERAAAGR
jgi:hypothetical protein